MTDVGQVGKPLSWQLTLIWINSNPYIKGSVSSSNIHLDCFLLLHSGGSFNLVFSSCCSFASAGLWGRVCLFLWHCLGPNSTCKFQQRAAWKGKTLNFLYIFVHAIQFTKTLGFMMARKNLMWYTSNYVLRPKMFLTTWSSPPLFIKGASKHLSCVAIHWKIVYLGGKRIKREECRSQKIDLLERIHFWFPTSTISSASNLEVLANQRIILHLLFIFFLKFSSSLRNDWSVLMVSLSTTTQVIQYMYYSLGHDSTISLNLGTMTNNIQWIIAL